MSPFFPPRAYKVPTGFIIDFLKCSSLFAISIRYGVLGGNLVWVVMFVVAMLAWWSTFYITDRPDEYDHPSLNGYQPLSTKMNVKQNMSSTAVMEECEMRSL